MTLLSAGSVERALESINRASLWWGLAAGFAVSIAATVSRKQRRMAALLPGIAGVSLAVVMFEVTATVQPGRGAFLLWVVASSTCMLAASWMGEPIHVLVVGVASALVGWATSAAATAGQVVIRHPAAGGAPASAAVIGTLVALGTAGLALALAKTTEHGGAPRTFPPILAASVGLFLCLPETTAPLVTLGFSIPLAVWAATTGRGAPRLQAASSAALAPPLVMTVVLGVSSGGERVLIGALGSLGTVAVWALVRMARRVKPGPPCISWLALSTGVGAAAIGIARMAVVRSSSPRVLAGTAAGLALLAMWCVLGEILASSRSSP